MTGAAAWAIAIPARDEGLRIGACLAAMAWQRDVSLADGAIVVLANNCGDDTARVARQSGLGTTLRVIEHSFPPARRNAGEARRLAMAHARDFVRDDGILLTTDADAVADDDWLAAMLACFSDRRVDAVAGRVSGNWAEMMHHPQAALETGALEFEYWQLTARAEAALDPQAHDPAPRHAQECGANLGIRAAMFDRVGGVPAVPVGEDRALLEAVFLRDGGIRHANGPHVTASARIDGRAEGGMATALRERIEGVYLCDELLLPAAVLERRLVLRREARAAFAEGRFAAWAAAHGVRDCPEEAHFGRCWAGFLARDARLAAAPLCPSALRGEIRQLEALLSRQAERHVA